MDRAQLLRPLGDHTSGTPAQTQLQVLRWALECLLWTVAAKMLLPFKTLSVTDGQLGLLNGKGNRAVDVTGLKGLFL